MTNKVNGNTKLGADLALKRRAISQESREHCLVGNLGLQEAKDLGAGKGPDGAPLPTSRISKDDRTRECMCGCGKVSKTGRFVPGHDARMHGLAREYLRGERELTDEQLEYVTESGKLERAHRRVAEEDAKRQEREAKQAKK